MRTGEPEAASASRRQVQRRDELRPGEPKVQGGVRGEFTATAGAKRLMSVEEAAKLLGTSRATLYRAIKRGEMPLPLFTIGRRLRTPQAAVERSSRGSGRAPEGRDDQRLSTNKVGYFGDERGLEGLPVSSFAVLLGVTSRIAQVALAQPASVSHLSVTCSTWHFGNGDRM
jgi:excisionase family DNA binding protein